MKKLILFILILLSISSVHAQRITAEQYIDLYKDLAIREMKRMGVPAAITLAQGLLETEGGNSELLKKSNNHFGIKCKDTWSGGGVSHDDDAKGECFRVYKNAEESYRDHSNFLRSRAWYAPLFKLDVTDYKGWAYGLKKAGYATNPKYPEILIKFIEDHHLQQYDQIAMNDAPHYDASKYKDDPEDKSIAEVLENTKETKKNSSDVVTWEPPSATVINKTKAVWEKAGASLLAIAIAHHLNLDKLLEYNDLATDGLLDKDQYIFIERKPRESDEDYYITKESESYWSISQKTGVKLKGLLEFNGVKEEGIVPAGSKVFLNGKRHSPVVNNSIDPIIHKAMPREGPGRN